MEYVRIGTTCGHEIDTHETQKSSNALEQLKASIFKSFGTQLRPERDIETGAEVVCWVWHDLVTCALEVGDQNSKVVAQDLDA